MVCSCVAANGAIKAANQKTFCLSFQNNVTRRFVEQGKRKIHFFVPAMTALLFRAAAWLVKDVMRRSISVSVQGWRGGEVAITAVAVRSAAQQLTRVSCLAFICQPGRATGLPLLQPHAPQPTGASECFMRRVQGLKGRWEEREEREGGASATLLLQSCNCPHPPSPPTTPVFTFASKTSCPFNFCCLIAALKIASHFRIHEIISRASPHSAVICCWAKIQIIFGLRGVLRDEPAERKRNKTNLL